MPGDPVYALEGVTRRKRVRELRSKAIQLKAVRDQLAEDLAGKEGEISALTSRQEVLAKVSELYRVLMDRMVMDQVLTIERIVSEGLHTIFFDQDLSFKMELSTKYNRISADCFICKGDPEKGGFKGNPLDSFGGGPSSIVSLVLRILTLLRTKRKKLLLLDETLGAVSDDYVEQTGQFLRKLSETTSLPILMVTHKDAYLEHSSVSYRGDNRAVQGTEEFTLKRMKGSG
jgi:hypothetical protein